MREFQIDVIVRNKAWNEKLPDNEKIITEITKKILEKVDFPAAIDYIEFSVILADDPYIRNVNYRFRNMDKATNVLSFPNIETKPPKFDSILDEIGYLMLGDVILALSTIEKEAKANKIDFKDHFHHLVIHGILHLLGYDHEIDSDAEMMEKLEVEILAYFNIASPYN